MGVGDLQVTRASSCCLRSLSSDLCVPSCSPPRGQPLPVFTEPTHGLGERGSPPWVESHTHHFLMCHQPQWAHSAARADPGAWSPAWSRPGQKEDDSPVSSTSQRPGNSKAPEAIWASVRTLSKYEEEETCLQKAYQPRSRTIKITGEMEPQGEV